MVKCLRNKRQHIEDKHLCRKAGITGRKQEALHHMAVLMVLLRYQENMNYRYPGINSTEIRNTQYAGTERLRTGSYESRKSYRAQSGVYQEKRPSSNRRGNSTVNIQDKSYMRGYYPPVYTAPSERPMANGMRTSSVSVYERPLGYTGGTTVTVPGERFREKF